MEITGHKTRAMLYRYSITVERDLREALQRTESFRKSLPAEPAPVAFPETKRKTSVV